MHIPHPHLREKARVVFKRIYQNQRINLKGSRQSLKDQLELYLEHLSSHLDKNISKKDTQRIADIISRNNHVASIINSRDYKRVTDSKKKLLGNTVLGLVYCIDGRIPAIFLGGRYASHWEVPAAELKVSKRKSDGKLIPESNDLCEALRKLVTTENDLLEVVLAHTSLLDPHHGCGAMAGKRKAGLLNPKLSNEVANLKIIEEKTIPAITNIYNDFREQKGFEPLTRVGVSALYDTDTFGLILNHDNPKITLSTTDLANQFIDQIEEHFSKENLFYASFKERFHYLKYLKSFSDNVLKVTEQFLSSSTFSNLSDLLDEYINIHYQDLTPNQKEALKFLITRSIAFQYLTGASSISKKTLSHPFAKHEEEYMAVSTRGTTIGKYDPQSQGFSSTPADPTTAIANIKTKLSIMGSSSENTKKTYLLFICNPVNIRDLTENSIQLHKIMDGNAELFRAILNDQDLGEMIENGKIIPVPVLVEEDSREVLKIIDHSAYT